MHHTERVALKDQKCNNIIKDSIRLNIIYAMTNSEIRQFKTYIFAFTIYRCWIACGIFRDWCWILADVPRDCSGVCVTFM